MKLAAGFPSTHPAFAGETGWRLKRRLLERVQAADAVLLLDWLDPGGTLDQAFPPGTEHPPVIQVSNDFHIHTGWNMDYGGLPSLTVNLPVVPETAVRALIEGLEARGRDAPGGTPVRWSVEAPRGSGEIGLMDLARAFYHAAEGRKLCITGRPLGWPANANRIEHPLDFLGHTGGGGLGAGPSIAVGAALALRETGAERGAVAILGDGDYVMGVTALWNAANLGLPVLFLIANNQSYFNDENHQKQVAERRGRPVGNAPIGQRMQAPELDLVALARAQGVEAGGPVDDLAELPGALAHALDRLAGGTAYVLDVRVRPEYVGTAMIDLSG